MKAHRVDSRAIQARGQSADAREGVSSFLEKRTPVYPEQGVQRHAGVLPVVGRAHVRVSAMDRIPAKTSTCSSSAPASPASAPPATCSSSARTSASSILESQAGFGGTWRTHRYPGIRSDSDLFTFGYGFKPWMGKPIATAAEIQQYLGEVIDENDLAPHIRYGQAVTLGRSGRAPNTAGPSRPTCRPRWHGDADASRRASCGCARATTAMPRATRRSGRAWSASPGASCIRRTGPRICELDGKKVVVIGSGATAATLIPAIADAART